MIAAEKFLEMYNKISMVIPFQNKWSNGTDYFDPGALPHPGEADCVKSTDTHGRKMIILGTEFGAGVVFERYSDDANGPIVCNIPGKFTDIIRKQWTGSLSVRELENIESYLGL